MLPTVPAPYPREELDEMVRRWQAAQADAERDRDWGRHLGPFYAEDAEYRCNLGPNREFFVRGRHAIVHTALGEEMAGFEDWHYPTDTTVIDAHLGEVVAFWRQVAPYARADGSPYQVAGTSGSRMGYAGNFQWSWQIDFIDLGNVTALITELAADGHLNPRLASRIAAMARGAKPEGHRPLRDDASSLRSARGWLRVARAGVLGR